jgi:hypothetical protein
MVRRVAVAAGVAVMVLLAGPAEAQQAGRQQGPGQAQQGQQQGQQQAQRAREQQAQQARQAQQQMARMHAMTQRMERIQERLHAFDEAMDRQMSQLRSRQGDQDHARLQQHERLRAMSQSMHQVAEQARHNMARLGEMAGDPAAAQDRAMQREMERLRAHWDRIGSELDAALQSMERTRQRLGQD